METTAETTTITDNEQPDNIQPEFDISDIQPKTHFTGKIIKTSLAGAIVDIGLEIPGVIHISQLQKEPVNRVEDVVQIGQTVDVWVRRVYPKKGRIELTMIEPLDLEWKEIDEGMVVKGKVTRLEKFGAFVDVGAERPGLIHISELAHGYVKDPSEIVHEGDEVEVKVLKVSRRKKQIKLSLKALTPPPAPTPKPTRSEGRSSRASAKQATNIVEENEPAVPTAMEMAMREAMERSKKIEEIEETKSKPGKTVVNNQELEDILARTLENKVRTAK
jgi:small subunit ribosomal protein S1